jgi:hypothetical protein
VRAALSEWQFGCFEHVSPVIEARSPTRKASVGLDGSNPHRLWEDIRRAT